MSFALAAVTFGLAAGLKPGPLGVFVIHQTLSKGYSAGFRASLAPVLTDGPIIVLALLLSIQFDEVNWFISLVSIIGGLYLANIAYKIFRAPLTLNPLESSNKQSSLFTAVKINTLNPSPYIFWLTIGSSYLVMGTRFEASIFIVCAVSTLCITKFGVAMAFKKLGDHFNPKVYAFILRSLSLPLLLFSLQLLYSGISIWLI